MLGPCSGHRKDGGASFSHTSVSEQAPSFQAQQQFNTRVAQEGNKVTDPSERELAKHSWVEGVAEGVSKV